MKKRTRKKMCKRNMKNIDEELSVWFAKFDDHQLYSIMQFNTFLSILYDLYSKQPDKSSIDTRGLVLKAKRITEEEFGEISTSLYPHWVQYTCEAIICSRVINFINLS